MKIKINPNTSKYYFDDERQNLGKHNMFPLL